MASSPSFNGTDQRGQQKRHVAAKATIANIIQGAYIKEEGEWAPNYILFNDKKIFRVNLIAAVVGKDERQAMYHSLTLDDGTGRISIRSFEGPNAFENINIGDVILVIGRPREYGGEKYIVAEILKPITRQEWIQVRRLELNMAPPPLSEAPIPQPETAIVSDPNPLASVIEAIRSLDSGSGAEIQELLGKLNVDNADRLIKHLVAQGDLFEVKPGRIKILE